MERLEDLWLLSRLQQERKAALQQQQHQQEQAAKQLQRPHTACDSAGNSAAPGNANVTAGAGVAQQAGKPVPLEQTPASMAPKKADVVPATDMGGTQPALLLATTPGSIASAQDAQPCTVGASAAVSAEEVPGSSVVGAAAAAPVSWLYDLD